ncbi:MAG: NAD-dependent epimerase/dehydratase family protein [Bacteroidetes bacterium]|nr:NAD-dependent epimerase/dehydratase family protein [Bacteroidota bacterium]
MQTILGAGGIIGQEIARALPAYTQSIRLVNRNPKAVNASDQLFPADLLQSREVFRAVEGSETVYLAVGLPYDRKTWQAQWPPLMRHVLAACEEFGARLVFFDNIYMYDPGHLAPMTEDAPWNPSSQKGQVRAEVARMVLDAASSGRVKALIARAADFYGPGIKDRSVLTETVFKPLSQGKKAQWLGSARVPHSFTYTPDAGKATALLGNTPDAYGQTWHLPTAANPMTGQEWVAAIAQALGAKPGVQVAPAWLVRVLGLFNPVMRELVEMIYQYDRPYLFDSTKFEKRFPMRATSYQEGIAAIVARDFSGGTAKS